MTVSPVAQPECLPEAVQRIARQFDPLRIILFGSWARGDARPDSDIDLLVVLPYAENKRLAAIRIGNALSDLPASKDIVAPRLKKSPREGTSLAMCCVPL